MNINGTNDFEDFLRIDSKYIKFKDNRIAREIFDYLSEINTINNMILMSENDNPALSSCIKEIESKYSNQFVFNLSDNFSKRALGAMIKAVLEPFGYAPVKQKNLAKGLSDYVTSASVYKKLNKPRLQLVQKLDICKLEN